MTLIDQIERAGAGEQRELLEAAARDAWGWNSCKPDESADDWVRRWNRFHRMLDAEAFESAVKMLEPKGWYTALALEDRHSRIWTWKLRGGFGWQVTGIAATEALARLSAILKTMEPRDAATT